MFYTFTGGKNPHRSLSPRRQTPRQKSVQRACDPCRKRKTRCDGHRPCRQCRSRDKTADCSYSSVKRSMMIRESNDVGSAPVSPHGNASSLFTPSILPTREDLVEHYPKHSDEAVEASKNPENPDEVRSLDQLQPFPEEHSDGQGDDASSIHCTAESPGITDEVNALSLSLRPFSTYLGVSSVIAAFRVIASLNPQSRAFNCGPTRPSQASDKSRSQRPLGEHLAQVPVSPVPPGSLSIWYEVPAINSYFEQVHPIVPLLDETRFRETYAEKRRTDSRWLLLLNAVLAMGSVAGTEAHDHTHFGYYSRAKEHLKLDILGFAHIETIQALTILGGLYLHYINKPVLANSLLGATYRMATTIGLHRDYAGGSQLLNDAKSLEGVELRRRLWWCLLIVDAWNTIFLGRPTLGRVGPGHTTGRPEQLISESSRILRLLQENIDACRITTQVEDCLVDRPILRTQQRHDLDKALEGWLQASCVGLQEVSAQVNVEPTGIIVAMNLMRWRCLSARIVIHRPMLLWYAISRPSRASLSMDKRAVIRRCRELAAELISDISQTYHVPRATQISGWIATWFLYQAAMVPLVSLFCDPQEPEVVASSTQQLETAKHALSNLERWSPMAQRSLEVVSRLHEESKANSQTAAGPGATRRESIVGLDMADYEAFQQTMSDDTPASFGSWAVGGSFFVDGLFPDASWDGLQGQDGFFPFFDAGDDGVAP